MAIEKTTLVDQITIVENGIVFVRTATRLIEDGVQLSQTFHRTSIAPGQDVSDQPANVQAACAAAWTPEVIAAYQATLPKAG